MAHCLCLKQVAVGSFCLAGVLLLSPQAHSWGERGHHVVAAMAARSLGGIAPATENGKALARFFADRAEILAYLSYVPDSAWRNAVETPRIERMNAPNHYFDPEHLLGIPAAPQDEEFERFLEKMRRLPADYRVLKERYDGAASPLPGIPAADKTLKLYEDLGTAPWRSQELYDLLVEAFACAKQKESAAVPARRRGAYPPVPSPFRLPADGSGETAEPPLPTYVCQADLPRESDLHAAVVIAGVLGHFIGDQGQPYHATADYDGWVTGNGGIHGYFESQVVRALDERLSADVLERAADPEFRRRVWRKVGTDLKAPFAVAQLLINLAVDSQSYLEEVRKIDDKVAIVKETTGDGPEGSGGVSQRSTRLLWGDSADRYAADEVRAAKRFAADDPRVLAAFRPLIVKRLASSAVVLARLWLAAWEAAGRPALGDQSAGSLPYPHNPPFLWPAFDAEALERSKSPKKLEPN